MGLESINKASAATQSVQTTAPVTANVQAAGSSTQTADYASSQAAQAVQLPLGQDSASAENAESKVTLADVKDISKVLNNNTVAEFGVYEPMNRITIKIKDKETGEVLRRFLLKRCSRMFTKACELAGLLVDEKM